ncbi:ATP-dependent acyl-CoA ligase, partial [Streptomyces sp. SID8455]|nr:ATP-dependent acyl-CoA ligase [Streptomyces sp. SID8455]
PQTVIYTSGTTGPSKGVVSSYAHLYSSCTAAFHGMAGPEDRYLLQLPLFHAGGTIGAYGMLVHGGSVTVVPAFTTSEFWPLIRRTGTTLCTLLGVMATYLLKQPPLPQDTGHPLRAAYVIPFTEGATEFSKRFGVSVRALFNMTEVSCPVLSAPDHHPGVPMHCGQPRPGITARVVDDHDREVADGEAGELVLRADRPWSFLSGYLGRPAETAAVWRNGWFHTGDTFRRAPDGGLVFVDRKKDAIRRRGENISSFEVEAQAVAHPGVLEAAAVAV